MAVTNECSYDDGSDVEPVLLVPPKLTKSSYATLLENNCVARRWHLEGRYGSRTHACIVDDYDDKDDSGGKNETNTSSNSSSRSKIKKKMALPLLKNQAKKLRNIVDQKYKKNDCEEEVDNNDFGNENLRKLLLDSDDIEIVYAKIHVPTNMPKTENFDATIHSNRRQRQIGDLPIPLPPSQLKKDNVTEPVFTYAELFAGIGGFGVALDKLGGQCVFSCEINTACHPIYKSNITIHQHAPSGDIHIHEDVWDVNTSTDIPCQVDLLVAGFPCQPFSGLGEQLGFNDTKGNNRGLLFTQIVRILKDIQPKAFLLENVPGLLNMSVGKKNNVDDNDDCQNNNNVLETIVSSLENVGYTVSVEICNSRCLLAQSRKRLFFVGLLKKNDEGEHQRHEKEDVPFEFPFIPDLGIRAGDIIEYNYNNDDDDEQGENKKADVVNDDDGIDFIDNSSSSMYYISNDQMNQLLTRSKRWKPAHMAWSDSVCDTMDSHYGNSVGKGNSQLVPTSASSCYGGRPRTFTIRECARLMGFPNTYIIPNEPLHEKQSHRAFTKQMYHMFGNAVCPPLVAAISGTILERICKMNNTTIEKNWIRFGLEIAIQISLDCVLPEKKQGIIKKLKHSKILI